MAKKAAKKKTKKTKMIKPSVKNDFPKGYELVAHVLNLREPLDGSNEHHQQKIVALYINKYGNTIGQLFLRDGRFEENMFLEGWDDQPAYEDDGSEEI